jgi:hypothetical protein
MPRRTERPTGNACLGFSDQCADRARDVTGSGMRGATEALPPDDRREGRLAVEGAADPQTRDNRGPDANEASQTRLAALTGAIAALDDAAVTIEFSRAIT